MARVFTVPERKRAGASELNVYGRFEVQDADGTYQDLSTIGGVDWFNSAQVADSIDQNASTIRVTLAREATPSVNTSVVPPEANQIAHWTLDGVATDSQGTNHGTLCNFSRTNSIIQSRDLSITWARTGTGSSVLNAVGIAGSVNTASTLTDTDAATSTFWHEDITVPVDTNTHSVSFWIKKDADTTRFPLFSIGISGGTSVARATAVNTSTGAIVANNIIGTSTQRIIDGALVGYAGWWILELTITNNGSASNTGLGISIFAAYGNVINVANAATTGSVVIGQVQAELNALVFTYPAITTTTAPATVALTGGTSPITGSTSISFDGSNDMITVPDVQALKYTGQDFSAFAWANRSQDDTTAGYIFSKPWNASGQYNWQLLINASGIISVILLGATSFTLSTSSVTLPAGSFHHVGFTVERATKVVRIYLDGAIVATGTHAIANWAPTLTDTNQALTIGSLYPYGAGWVGVLDQAFRGFIDDPRIYSAALSPLDVDQLYMWRGTKSLAPFVTASTVNRNLAGTYAPLLDLGRKYRMSAALTGKGDAPRTRLNSVLWSRDLTHWSQVNSVISAFNAVGLDGLPNTATTLTDSSGTLGGNVVSATVVVPTDLNTHTATFWIAKDDVVSRFPLLYAQISGGTSVSRGVWLNTSTGAMVVSNNVGTGLNRLIDGATLGYPGWWVVEITLTNNGTASNTNIAIQIDPARGSVIGTVAVAATGSVIVGNVEVGINQTSFSQLPVYTNAATATVNDWKEISQGYVDSIDWGGKNNSVVTVSGRDLTARILDAYISTRRVYGSTGGTAMETVIQNLLDDNVGVNARKTTGTAVWDEQVYSATGYASGAYAAARPVTYHAMFGLNTDPLTDASYASIDYAFYLSNPNVLSIYENGTPIGIVGTFTTDDLLEITYSGTTVVYKQNGTIVRTVTGVTAGLTFFFDSSFHSTGEWKAMRFGSTALAIGATQFVASSGIALTGGSPTGTTIVLTTPTSPSFLIRTFVQDYSNLMDAINQVAAQAGFVVRYRYDATDTLVLTLYKPDRTLTNGVTFSLGPEEYLDVPGLKISLADIRNYIELRYIDAGTGALTLVTSPVSGTSASITKYGKRYMAIDEQNGSQINSTAQAQAMVDAVASDLQDPGVEHVVESFLLWWVQLSDYIQFNQNTVLYDSAQFGAVTGYTHTLANGTGKTSISTRGKPAGGYKTWLSYAKALGGEYTAPRIVPPAGLFQIASEDGAFGYVNFVFDDPQGNVANYRVTTISNRATATTGSPVVPLAGGAANTASVPLVDKIASYIDVDWYGIDADGSSGALLGHMRFTFGLGARPVAPDIAYATAPSSSFPNGGILTASASIDNDTANVRCVASKTGKPSDADVNAASPVAVGAGSTSVNLGTLLSGLNTGERYWIRARSYNLTGLESDITDLTDVYVAGSTNALATLSLTATNPSSTSITFVVKPNSHCAEFEIFIKEYDGTNTDPGTAVAIDTGYPTPLDSVVVGTDATRYRAQPNADYNVVVPIAAGTNWILVTIVPYDAIARQGTKLNAKGRGNGTTAPLPPISTTADAAPTATSITNKVTLATPRADRVKMYRDNVWFGALVDVSAQANGALVTLPADTGLTPGTTYSYTYAGVDSATGIESVGRTSPVNVATTATATIPTPTLASASYNAATETWSFTVTPGASSPAGVTWKIERATSSGGVYSDRTATFSTSTSLSESDPMDTPTGTDFYFKVYGSLTGWTDSVHSAFVGPIHKTGTGEPATAPTIGSITNPLSHNVAVSWTNTDTLDAIYIEVERFQGGAWTVAGSKSVAAGATASGNIGVTTVGIPYRGRARYYNAARNGAWSAYTSQITIT